MSFRTPLPAKKVLGFTIVNYTFRAVLNVFFMSLLLAGFGVLLTASLADPRSGRLRARHESPRRSCSP